MVKEELIINGTPVPLEGSLDPNITYSIQDITQPDKRKSAYSKTIKLPASKKLNDIFNFIFEINIDGTFNPNKKANAKYLVDSQLVLDGFLKLNAVEHIDNSCTSYDCTLFGSLADFFTDLAELELTDIQNLNDWDHPYDYSHITLSWDNQVKFQGGLIPFQFGRGYVYPLIDYGVDNSLESWKVSDMYPAFYVKELFDRIFDDAGYSYTSNFLNTDPRFKKAIVPFNGDKFGLSEVQILRRRFTADTPVLSSPMTNIYNSAQTDITFVDVDDAGDVHNAGVFTAPATGRYTFQSFVEFTAEFVPEFFTEDVRPNTKLETYLQLKKNGSLITERRIIISPDYDTVISPPSGSYTTPTNPTYPDKHYNTYVQTPSSPTCGVPSTISPHNNTRPNRITVNLVDYLLNAGDTITVGVRAVQKAVNPSCKEVITGFTQDKWYGATGKYDGKVNLNIVNAGLFKGRATNTIYFDGDDIDMYGALPRNIKQKDFVMSIVNMFGLFIEPDSDDPRNFRIEPREQFYTPQVHDWSLKLDVSQPLQFKPMGLLDASRYLFTYKEDKDYYNQKYLQAYDDIYGQREIVVDNDFLSNTNTNEIIFSPSPLVGQSTNDRVITSIITVDQNEQAQRTNSNIRYLIYDGLKPTESTWTLEPVVQTTYPYAGHFYPDPFNPTHDVNFGLPQEIYYDDTFNAITVTDSNLYNDFHRKRIEEITDKDSKIVVGRFYLTPQDIMQLSFRGQYWFNNAYHRLLKVNNYNPSEVSLTECHFLKLKSKEQYTPITEIVKDIAGKFVGGGGSKEPVPMFPQTKQKNGNNYNTKTATVNGHENFVGRTAEDVYIQGDDNIVMDDVHNVFIQGNNNKVQAGLENVTILGTNDVTVTESNTTIINGRIQAGSPNAVAFANSELVFIQMKFIGYELTPPNPYMDARLPDATQYSGSEIWLKKVSDENQNEIRVQTILGQTLDGETEKIFKKQNTTMVIVSDGLNWIIK